MKKRQDRMGHVVHQFKALFWKNWVCRVRQPVLSLSEILWPCVLFFILAAIRFQEPPKYKENCYLEARDLPSRGLYPFVRALFCNVGSRCRNTSYTTQKNSRLRTSGLQGGPENFIGPDLAFMKEIQDLAKGFIETTEKAMALEKLWEEDSKFSGLHNSTTFLTVNLNEAEEMISRIENLYKQPHFWELLHSLPRLKLNSFYTEDGLGAIAQFLKAIKNTFASLEDLAVMPLGQSFYEVVKRALNLTAASVHFLQDRSLEGFQYNLSLWDVLWDPHAVRVELKSRFGLDDLCIKKLLSYASQLPEIPTEETLEQFVCSALSSVPGNEANGENNDEGCVSAWHETKLYLVHAVSKLRLYSQVYHQWFSSNQSQKLLSELEGMIADLMSQFLDDIEARKIVSGISTLILQWNEKSEAYFSEGHTASHDLINNRLEEIWFAFEGNPYWKDLTTFVGWMCEVAQYVNEEAGSTDGLEVSLCSRQKLSLKTISLGHYSAFLQNLSDYSPFTSWAWILTSVKELLEREENLRISGEKEISYLLQLTEFIEEIAMPNFSVPSNLQSLMETVLNNTIAWINNFAEGGEFATDFSPAVSELHNELLKNFQPLQRFRQKEKTEFFWQTVKMMCYELVSRLSQLSQVEEVEVLDTLSRIIFSIPENEKILNRSMLLLQNILTGLPDLNIVDMSYLHLSEDFIRDLYEVGSLTEDHVNTTFNTIHGASNASSFLILNATLLYKVRELGDIVFDFFKDIQKLNNGSAASLVQILFSVYQNMDLLLNIENNSALLTYLYETSKDISSLQVWHDFQDRDKVFDLLSETFNLLWNFSGKPLCEKLLTIYNYTEFQAQSLAQKDEKEMQVVYNTLSSLKTLFMDEELQTAAFCYLEEFFGVSAECMVNNGCIDFYLSNATSAENSIEVYDFLLLPLNSILSNITKLGDEINVPSALHCTFIWLQTWTEVFEEVSKILSLNSTFFVSLRYGLANVSESFLNTAHAELCNKTTMLIVEATTAMNLLKSIVEGGDINGWKDLEALLSNLQSVLNNAIDVTSLLTGNSLEDVLEIMGTGITELQKSVLNAVNGDFLNSWLDTFISGGSEGEGRDANIYSIGNSLSTILKLSKKELGIILTEIKDTTAFLKSISQDKYLVCISFFQNITKLILDNILQDKSHSQINLSPHLNSFLNFSTVGEAEDCNRWMHILSNLSEKYKTPSHLESVKHTLFLLKSLGSIETDVKQRNMMDFINLVFNLVFPECSLSASHVLCINVYFNIITKTLKFILPEFYGKDDVRVLDFIFTLVNSSGGQIPMLVNNLMGHLQYTSNETYFTQSIHGSNRNSSILLNPFHHHQLFLTEFLAEIQTLLKNKTSGIQQNSSSPLNTEFKAFLHEKNINLFMQFFQHMINYLDSKLPHKLQGEYNTLQALIKTAALNVELVRKALKTFKSSTLIGFPIRGDKEFPKHVVALVQNLENTDVEFLIGQFKQVQRSLDHLFKSIESLYIENSELGTLPDWWDTFENNLCNWNLTGFRQLAQLLQQDELSDVVEMFHLLLDVVSLTEGLAHRNITEALTDVYTFILTQEAKIPMFTKEELSNQVESVLMLLEALSDMPDEPAEALICISAVFCWSLTTATPQSDPAFKPCDFDVHSNFSLAYSGVVNIIKQLKLIPLEDSSSCIKDFQTDIIRNLTCFFHQIREWNSLLLKFSELHHLNDSVLKELLDFWNELSIYAVPLQASITDSVTCSSTLKMQAALQLIETLDGMTVAEMEAAKAILEQLNDLYGALNLNGDTKMSLIKTVLSNFKNMTHEVSGLLDTEPILSFFSVAQPLITISSVGNQTYSVLMALAALNKNGSASDNFENFWLRVESSIENLLVNFNVRHLLMGVEQGFQLLRVATGHSSSVDLDVPIQQFNTSSVDAMLRNFEDIQEIVNSFLCECNTKDYSKIMHILIFLMANEKSSDDLLLVVKDIIDFLELFQNESKEDYIDMFYDDDLNRENLNNTHIADSVLQNGLLHMIADLAIIEEALHSNNTELHIVDFIDLFFHDAQHGSYGKSTNLFQNRTLEIMQEVLQMIFPSSTEHDRNRIAFLLKYLHEDITAEMRASNMCQILQKHLPPAVVVLLQKLQLTTLNVLKIFSEEPALISNFFCVVTKCKDGLMSRFLLSVIEGIILVRDHYQDITRMWSAFNKGDCENMAYISQKFSNTLESFLRTLQNTADDSCECHLLLENIQRHLQMLAENLEPLLSENPVVAVLSNFNLLNDVKVKDCVWNTTELELDIRSSINISEETIRTVLEANISHSKLFYSAFAVALAGRCDEEVLSLLLTLPENSKTSLVVEELCSLPALDLYTMFLLIIQNLNLRHIIYKIKIPSEIRSLLNTLLDVVSSISSLLNKDQRVMEDLPVFLQAVKNIGVLDISVLQQFLQGGQLRRSAVGSLESVIKAVCKEESSFFSNTNMFIDMPRITELLEDNMAKYGIPEDSTPFCLKLYQEILQSSNGPLVWTFLKPLLHGKILYYSNINMIDLVIEKANFTFAFVENLKTYSHMWLRMSEAFKNNGKGLVVSRLQEALQNNFIKHFVESHLNIDVGKLIEKMQVYETMMDKMLNSSATKQIDLLSQLLVNTSSCILLDRFQPFESIEKLEEKAHELMQQNNFLASIIFNVPRNETQESRNLPQHISYTIRTSVLYSMRTDLIKNPMWKSHPQNLPADGFKYNHIFIPLQDMIERAIISVHTGTDTSEPAIQVQAMPYPCHTSDLFLNNIGFFFPLMMMLTWMVSVAGMVRKLVYEREIHLEEYMKTMGVHPAIHFLAWFLENVIVLTISSCALVIILKASGIFAYSNSFLIFLFLLDFGVAVIMFSYLLGAFFRSANTAALCASLVYMISFLPYIVLLVLQNQLNFASQIVTGLLSTTAFGQGIFFVTLFEGQEVGIQWNNMYQPIAQGGYMTFGWMCWMMFFDSILYSIGGWYFSNIIPGKFGIRNQWYFPFTVSYWKNLCGKKHYLNSNMFFFQEEYENFQEKDPGPPGGKGAGTEGATIGVVLLSLTKEHVDGQQAAVKDLSLTFHQGQITALLGPNGAGKTTVISLLTGLYPPSSGTIIINGKDIRTDLAAIRTELGVCPQFDVLFDMLTVREHLLLYGSVKAPIWTTKQLNQQVSGALEDVDLSEHQYKLVGALPGGMKRRLSIAISFIGNSRTVVLDEPTSGVDPCSRRSIWDVLLKYKPGCTLIFTTHHLDEAEVLSDRIAILQHGQLRCCGSPTYLRETYGQGHSLTLIKKPSVFEIQDPKHIVQVTSLVQTHIPEAFLKENNGTELTYVIPERVDKTSFKGLFQALDESLHHLHVIGYGISDTTLEEVFLKLLQDSGKMPCVPQAAHLDHANGVESAYISLTGASSVCGASLVLTQIVALLMKKFHHARRDWRGSLSKVLLPVLFVAMAMALFSVKPLAIDYPSLKLTPGLYENAESFFSTEDDNLGDLSQILLRHFSDLDHACIHSQQGKNNSCWQMESTSNQHSCGCVTEQEMCASFNVSAPYVKNKKGHILYNLSGFFVEEYLVRPSNKPRYGGWSFGEKTAFELQDLKLNNTKYKPLAKVWYNQKGFHSLPSYLNELNNFILWLNLPPTVDWRQYGITLYSQPYGGAFLDEDKIMENVRQCGVALCIMLGFSILTASIGSAIVKDRVSGTKRLQHITGLGYRAYWLANFFCDMLFYMVPVTLCVGVITAFQLSAFTFRENLAATVLLLILFGYATLPWMYLVSRFFSSSEVAFISYISLNFVFGLCTMLVTLLPRLLAIISKAQSFQNIYDILKWAFIIFPQFCLGQGLIELSYNQIKFDLTSSFGIDSYVSPFEMNFLGWIFVEMALQGTVLLLLRIFIHWDLLQKTRSQCSVSSMVNTSEDTDVEMERQRLFGGRTGNDILLLYNLRKCYGGFSKKKAAVENISLGIPRGECFGLLGTNGAGKSTTFKMLTGDIIPSAGRAVIRTPTGSEMDILSASSEGIHIGYCPQQDALDELLTGQEHLHYYCTLRGIPKQYIHKVAADLVNRLHLNAHVDKLVRTYSCGTKRKLSTAVALVGKPQILLLDEPSSGMDPCSKRYLWKTILKEVQDGCAAVLTSHSMEECEALCTRLAIMVNGSFKCLGSPQHIKNRFGDGYSVKVWLSKEINYGKVILDCLQLHFPGTHFKGQHLNLLEYHVPRSQGCLAELFKVLENHKAFLQIKHYSISQTTLEQVFINFATQQQEVLHPTQESRTILHDHLPV